MKKGIYIILSTMLIALVIVLYHRLVGLQSTNNENTINEPNAYDTIMQQIIGPRASEDDEYKEVKEYEILFENIISFADYDTNQSYEILMLESLSEWLYYADRFYKIYHINLDEQINYYSDQTIYDIDFSKQNIYVRVIPNWENHFAIDSRNTNDANTTYDIKETVCVTREQRYKAENMKEEERVVNHMYCSILAVDKSFKTEFPPQNRPFDFDNTTDITESSITEIENYETYYSGFMSILAEKIQFPPLRSTFIIDSKEELLDFESKLQVKDFSQTKYLNLNTEKSPLNLDYDKFSFIICFNTFTNDSRTYGYPIKRLFIKDNNIIPVYDYKNKATIINASASHYPEKSKHIYFTLIKVDKKVINK